MIARFNFLQEQLGMQIDPSQNGSVDGRVDEERLRTHQQLLLPEAPGQAFPGRPTVVAACHSPHHGVLVNSAAVQQRSEQGAERDGALCAATAAAVVLCALEVRHESLCRTPQPLVAPITRRLLPLGNGGCCCLPVGAAVFVARVGDEGGRAHKSELGPQDRAEPNGSRPSRQCNRGPEVRGGLLERGVQGNGRRALHGPWPVRWASSSGGGRIASHPPAPATMQQTSADKREAANKQADQKSLIPPASAPRLRPCLDCIAPYHRVLICMHSAIVNRNRSPGRGAPSIDLAGTRPCYRRTCRLTCVSAVGTFPPRKMEPGPSP
eukprot:COSAG01_NODE_629_length_14689_cov_298.955517_11_plen_323_part_00